MPTLNFRRIDLDLLYPPFLEKLLDAVAACEARGARYIATHGHRTYGAQMALWAQGRTVKGPRVTGAKGGQSAHNFGLAVDFVRDGDLSKDGVQPLWDAEAFKVLIEECEKRGLHSGKGYGDLPHVSWPGYVTAADLKLLDEVWGRVGTRAVGTLDALKEVWKVVK